MNLFPDSIVRNTLLFPIYCFILVFVTSMVAILLLSEEIGGAIAGFLFLMLLFAPSSIYGQTQKRGLTFREAFQMAGSSAGTWFVVVILLAATQPDVRTVFISEGEILWGAIGTFAIFYLIVTAVLTPIYKFGSSSMAKAAIKGEERKRERAVAALQKG